MTMEELEMWDADPEQYGMSDQGRFWGIFIYKLRFSIDRVKIR